MPYNVRKCASTRPIATNRVSQYTAPNSYTPKPVEPYVKIQDGNPIIVRSKGMDFVVEYDSVCVFSIKHDKVIFSITDDEIVIGNKDGEHIKVKLS